MEGMKTLDIRSYRETIKAAVAHERQADPNWSWGIRSITKGVARIGWGYLDYGKKTAIGRRGCLFMPPDAKGPHGAAQGPAGANAKRPPRAWESPKREGAFAQIFLA